MSNGFTGFTHSSHPQIQKLQEQLEELLPNRASAHADKAAAAPASLLGQLPINASFMMEIASVLVRWLRRPSDHVKREKAGRHSVKAGQQRSRSLRRVLAIVATLGVTIIVRHVVFRRGCTVAKPTTRVALPPAQRHAASRPRVRVA